MGVLYESLYRVSLRVGATLSPKLAQGLGERHGLMERLEVVCSTWREAPLWVHVASAGELEQAIPVLEELKKISPAPIVLTYFSPSAAGAVRREQQRRVQVPWDVADYSPLDTVTEVGAFLDRVRPRAFIAVHRELWPGIVESCAKRQIPLCLIAAQLSGGLPWIQRRLLKEFSLIATTDEASRDWARKWAGGNVESLGDPRVARIVSRRDQSPPPLWLGHLNPRPNLVLASLWNGDFVSGEPFFRHALELGWRLVLVPHEPDPGFLRRLEGWLTDLGQAHTRWSEWDQKTVPDHLVVDQVGLLNDLYRGASLAFVGGSFERRVHNVLEPAAHGCPVLTGPKIQNSREALEMKGGPLIATQDARELAVEGHRLLKDEQERRSRGEMARQYLAPQAAAARATAVLLWEGLDKKKG